MLAVSCERWLRTRRDRPRRTARCEFSIDYRSYWIEACPNRMLLAASVVYTSDVSTRAIAKSTHVGPLLHLLASFCCSSTLFYTSLPFGLIHFVVVIIRYIDQCDQSLPSRLLALTITFDSVIDRVCSPTASRLRSSLAI